MKRSKFDETKDQRVADEGAGKPRQLMCSAHGCPNLWSTSDGHLCRWHAEADPDRWPELTQQLQWDETERACKRGEPKVFTAPLAFAEKRAILSKLAAVFDQRGKDPKAWAKRLRNRHLGGDKVPRTVLTMARDALTVVHVETEA